MPAMDHPKPIRPQELANWSAEKMGKSTIFQSERVMVGLNAFEPGQEHALHAHSGMDKVYQVVQGKGLFLLEDSEVEMDEGMLMVAPEGVPHGIRNAGSDRLLVLAILAPAPG
jgi:quercetin dioxygenase-like cupin family protein